MCDNLFHAVFGCFIYIFSYTASGATQTVTCLADGTFGLLLVCSAPPKENQKVLFAKGLFRCLGLIFIGAIVVYCCGGCDGLCGRKKKRDNEEKEQHPQVVIDIAGRLVVIGEDTKL